MTKINQERKRRMQQRSVAQLTAIVEGKTLSSAAAAYELQQRAAKDEAPRT